MPIQTETSSVISLTPKIGQYNNKGSFCIGLEGEHELYQGIEAYQKTRIELVKTYNKDFHENLEPHDSSDPQFFRKKLLEYLQKHPFPEYQGDLEQRKTHPEKATTDMEKFLGKQGLDLFKLALEEEMCSKEFRDAVVLQSTTHFDGPKWQERPVVIVAGPSGSGKSYAAKAAVEKANQFLPANPDDMRGNDVIAADGGIIREVSQIRKLVIQLANNQGYTGIKDLYKESNEIMDDVKNRVREAAFKTPGLGVVIPETFSGWFKPFSKVRGLMKQIDELSDTRQLFARVEGHDESNFKKVVAFMGSRRAWKTKDFEYQELDLNKTDLAESKAYNGNGFGFGESGSKHAENWFKAHSKEKLSMVITNDLILLKPDPKQPGNWITAEQGDEGTRLFSESAYNQWKGLTLKPDLVEYCKTNSKTQIKASAQTEMAVARNTFAIAQKNIGERIKACHTKMHKTMSMEPRDEKRLEYLQARLDLLEQIAHFSVRDLESYDEIQKRKADIEDHILIIKEELGETWPHVFTKKTMRVLEGITNALDDAAIAIENTPIVYVGNSDTSGFKKQYNEAINKLPEHEDLTDEDTPGAYP